MELAQKSYKFSTLPFEKKSIYNNFGCPPGKSATALITVKKNR